MKPISQGLFKTILGFQLAYPGKRSFTFLVFMEESGKGPKNICMLLEMEKGINTCEFQILACFTSIKGSGVKL